MLVLPVSAFVRAESPAQLKEDGLDFMKDSSPKSKPKGPAASESRSAEYEQKIREGRKVFDEKFDKVTSTKTAEEFVAASDDLALYLTGVDKFPDAVNAKEVADQIEKAYLALPRFRVSCGPKTRGDTPCYSPGTAPKAAYKSVINVLRETAPCEPPSCYGDPLQ